MSIIKKSIAACSKCGERQEISVYKSINVSENPELKEMVKDGSLFLWKCDGCGQANLAKYDTLYHDPENRLMVWLLSDENMSESQMHSISLHAKAIGNYTLRRVTDIGDLMEKVLIFDNNLEDTVIEMCKYVLKMEMISKAGNENAAKDILDTPIHFFRCNGENEERSITFVYPEKGEMKNLNIGYNVYEDCCGIIQRNPHIKAGSGFEKIDSLWLAKFFS